MICPDKQLDMWEYCDNSVILANADWYYTKQQTEELIDSVSGMNPTEVQDMINRSIHSKADKTYVDEKDTELSDSIRAINSNMAQRYTKTETNNLLDMKVDKSTYSAYTATTNEAINNKQDKLVSSSNIKTINGESILGSGDLVVRSEGDVTSGEVQTMIDEAVSGKQDTLIAGDNITIVNNVISSTASGDVTSAQVETMIAEATNDMATQTWVQNQGYLTEHQSLSAYSTTQEMNDAITAATDDMATQTWVNQQGFLTEHQSLSAYSTTQEMNEAISASTSGKVDTTAYTAYTAATDTALAGKQNQLTAGANISISGDVISAEGGNDVVELTQQQYDQLQEVDPTVFYVITDAEPIDMADYVKTSAFTQAMSGKQDTLIAGSGISIDSSNTIACTVEGKTYTAGRGISIASDTISVSLPISAGTGGNSIVEGNNQPSAAYGTNAHAEGESTSASANAHAEGYHTTAGHWYSHSEGYYTNAGGKYSHAEGSYTKTNNEAEHASGFYNVSNTASTDSGKTLFSVGNGTSNNTRHNAIDLRQNGDFYISDVDNTDYANYYEKPMKRLQDYIQFKIVKLTQDAYDALVSGGTVDPNTIYYIVEQ